MFICTSRKQSVNNALPVDGDNKHWINTNLHLYNQCAVGTHLLLLQRSHKWKKKERMVERISRRMGWLPPLLLRGEGRGKKEEDGEGGSEEPVMEPEKEEGEPEEPGMWEETFKTHHDSKPYGIITLLSMLTK